MEIMADDRARDDMWRAYTMLSAACGTLKNIAVALVDHV